MGRHHTGVNWLDHWPLLKAGREHRVGWSAYTFPGYWNEDEEMTHSISRTRAGSAFCLLFSES